MLLTVGAMFYTQNASQHRAGNVLLLGLLCFPAFTKMTGLGCPMICAPDKSCSLGLLPVGNFVQFGQVYWGATLESSQVFSCSVCACVRVFGVIVLAGVMLDKTGCDWWLITFILPSWVPSLIGWVIRDNIMAAIIIITQGTTNLQTLSAVHVYTLLWLISLLALRCSLNSICTVYQLIWNLNFINCTQSMIPHSVYVNIYMGLIVMCQIVMCYRKTWTFIHSFSQSVSLCEA